MASPSPDALGIGEPYEVTLDTSNGTSLGFRLVADPNPPGTGFVILAMTEGGIAEASGVIQIGDKVLAMNGVDVSQYTEMSGIRPIVQGAPDGLIRIELAAGAARGASGKESAAEAADGGDGAAEEEEAKEPERGDPNAKRVAVLDASASGAVLGMRLESNPIGRGFLIKSLDPAGLAQASRFVFVGDYISAVNGKSVLALKELGELRPFMLCDETGKMNVSLLPNAHYPPVPVAAEPFVSNVSREEFKPVNEVMHIWIEKSEEKADWRSIGREKTLPRKVSVGALTVRDAHHKAIRKSSVAWTQEEVEALPEHKEAHVDTAADATPKTYDELMAERLANIKKEKAKKDAALLEARHQKEAYEKGKKLKAKRDAEEMAKTIALGEANAAEQAKRDAARAYKERLAAAEAHRVAMSEEFHTGNPRGAKQGAEQN